MKAAFLLRWPDGAAGGWLEIDEGAMKARSAPEESHRRTTGIARAALLALCAGILAAQADPPIRGPVLGYVFDNNWELRPILGIPGAAHVGDPLNLGLDVLLATISPEQDYVLVLSAKDRTPFVFRLASLTAASIAGAKSDFDRIALSPGGGSALLYHSETGHAQILTRLPRDPAAVAEIELGEAPSAVAISDDGERVLVASARSLVILNRQGEARLVPASQAGSIAFLHRGRDALVAERAGGRLFLLRDSGEQIPLDVPSVDVLGETIALAASVDNTYAVIAGAEALALTPLGGGPAELVRSPCQVTGLSRLEGNGVFRLNEFPGAPLWLLDGARTVFVPVAGGGE